MRTYWINDVFHSIQGEGLRAGTPNLFIRFSGCNLACRKEPGEKSPGGFDCDTEFTSGRNFSLDELWSWMEIAIRPGKPRWVILTGGEPTLQIDEPLIDFLKDRGCSIAIETNGTNPVIDGVDWITCSPKVAEHALRIETADEIKYVRGYGQGIPKPKITASYKFLSPAFLGDQPDPQAVEWCRKLVMENPEWRLTGQLHKLAGWR